MQTAQHHPSEIYASVTDAENEFVRKLIFSHPVHMMQKKKKRTPSTPLLRSRQMLQNTQVMVNLRKASG